MPSLDPGRTALVLVDLMERIVALPLAPRPGTDVLAAAARLADTFRAAGAPVVHIRVERPNIATQPPGSELVPDLVQAGDHVVVKRTIGGFHDTGLHALLTGAGATTLVLGGIATNLGVESTARAAGDLGYDLVFAEDAMTALTADEHRASVELDFPRLGTVAPVSAITLDGPA
ncbi:Nicotinamidase or isochorismatase family protein [Streptomyces venezuelae]|uniref:isochorismatase family protein n=1 Tax=Streptomyces gardneri TaxID=66892 RepID=UPI0006BC7374|nr:isochorismatase family protein [Streptomyces gardneri]ALO12011.1 Nicotinamidase or isochorismatase family protein [Streptomyces venezuelae]QPK48854.1 isochorismatase family protein [Streptomyces gardneri]WRK40337.1 isochorismatase family protein [Streptomyces venezuelae]CUM37418.1 Nicotinamidase/isochorismatase family protein [Streptomyces venezuelae]